VRVGWFGGSFDPPHKGHVAVARAAADRFGLELVLFAPVGRQPLKDGGAGALFVDRMAMVALVCGEDSRFRASEVDAPRVDGGANYTVDALERLMTEMSEMELFGIVGMDAFLQMPRWREPERLREMAEWIVVTRPGYGGEVSAGSGVHLLEDVQMDISATMLRERLSKGEPCAEWVAGAVLSYIAAHGLYR
jgi:nicotinate-nucleotide adenylyltransferase